MVVSEILTALGGSLAADQISKRAGGNPFVVPPGAITRTFRDLGNSGVVGEIDNIPASGVGHINISENDLNRYGNPNFMHIINNSDEDMLVWLDGAGGDRQVPCASGAAETSVGIKFSYTYIENLTASEPASGEIVVNIGWLKEAQ